MNPMNPMDSLYQLILMRLREMVREPSTLFWTLGFPILMTLALGQVSSRPNDVRATVAVIAAPGEEAAAANFARQAVGQELVQWLPLSEADLNDALATGRIRVALEHAWDPAHRRWRLDPADSQARLSYYHARDTLEARPADTGPLKAAGSRYIDFVLPGLLALGLVNNCLWGIGWNVVELRQKRLLRLMLATPLEPWVFFAALFFSRLLLSLVEAGLLLGFSRLLFGVRVLGSWVAFGMLWICGLSAFFGLAVLIACRTDRAEVGQGLINAVTLPIFVLSGVFFSLDKFPVWMQTVFRLFPPTLLVDTTRSVMNTTVGIDSVVVPSAALLVMGGLCFGLGRRWFRFY